MKNNLLFITIFVVTLLLNSCKKENDSEIKPIIETSVITNIGSTDATSGGTISYDGQEPILEKGVCWSENEFPDTASMRTSDGNGPGSFTSTISGLTFKKTYYIRAYAITAKGVYYGNTLSFATNYYKYSGQVIDQVAKQPVQNAKIYIGNVPFCEDYNHLWSWGTYAVTDVEGKFNYQINSADWPARDFNCPMIYARKENYAGSDVFPILKGGVVLAKPIEMYHFATVKVRVVNDTISNNVDAETFGMSVDYFSSSYIRCYPNVFGNTDFMGRPAFQVKCSGRKYDSTFIFTNCWGTKKYNASFIQNYPITTTALSVAAKSDSIVDVLIKF